jgi:hypothetical protein
LIYLVRAAGTRHFDTASLSEIEVVRGRYPSAVCHFMAPVRLPGTARTAFEEHNIRDFVVDCEFELDKLLAETNGGRDCRIFVRLATRPGGAAFDLSGKFGTAPGDAVLLLRRVDEAGASPALTFHVGSQCLNPLSYVQAVELACRTIGLVGMEIAALDLGGGFPAPYPGQDLLPYPDYFAAIGKALSTLPNADKLSLLCEPGRALIAEGVSLITQVVLRKGDKLYSNDGIYGSFDELTLPGSTTDYHTSVSRSMPIMTLSSNPRPISHSAFTARLAIRWTYCRVRSCCLTPSRPAISSSSILSAPIPVRCARISTGFAPTVSPSSETDKMVMLQESEPYNLTKHWQALDAAHHVHPFTDTAALNRKGAHVIVRADGVYLWDSDGNKIIDGLGGLWCVQVGSGNRELAEAGYEALKTLPCYNHFFKTTNPWTVELAAKLARLLPEGHEHVLFANSGSDANDSALKLIRYYWNLKGRPEKKIHISRDLGYHGATMAAGSLSGLTPAHPQWDLPLAGFEKVPAPYWFGAEAAGYGDIGSKAFGILIARRLEDKIRELGPHRVASFSAEPIQGPGRTDHPALDLLARSAAHLPRIRRAAAPRRSDHWLRPHGRMVRRRDLRHRARHYNNGEGPFIGLSANFRDLIGRADGRQDSLGQ